MNYATISSSSSIYNIVFGSFSAAAAAAANESKYATMTTVPTTSTASTAMEMFQQMSGQTPTAAAAPATGSSTANEMFKQMQQQPAATGDATLPVTNSFANFLKDNVSLNQLPSLGSLPSFSIPIQELAAGTQEGLEAAGGECQTVAAEEEVVGEEQEEEVAPQLLNTLSVNTTQKINEAIDAINHLNE